MFGPTLAMPWGDVAYAVDRHTKESDAVLLVAAADAGLSLRAVAGRCFWAFEDEVPGCEAFTLRRTPNAGLCGIAARGIVRGERVLTERPLPSLRGTPRSCEGSEDM